MATICGKWPNLAWPSVSLEYDQTNETAFAVQFEALLRYLGRQKWADTNAIAWVGFSLGANRMLDFALQHPDQQPQLLVQLSGAGLPEKVKPTITLTNSTAQYCLFMASRMKCFRWQIQNGWLQFCKPTDCRWN